MDIELLNLGNGKYRIWTRDKKKTAKIGGGVMMKNNGVL